VFTIKLDAGTTYRIDHRGGDRKFDAFLILEDADGNGLDEDDDSGGGLNAQLVLRPAKTGTYRVIATTLPAGQTGKFTLEIGLADAKDKGIAVKAEPFRRKLTSALDNLRIAEIELTSKEITPDCPFAWSIRKVTLHGGRQEGSELLIVDNGKLQVTLIPTRGMGILSARLGDVRLGWDSPVKEVVHPKFMNLQARGGLGWLDGFSEWLVRCGLENNGQAGKDEFINNMGDKATMDLTLHGKIANLPAQELEVIVERAAPYRITIRGVVHERMLFGPKLELLTAISTIPGTSTFRLHDVVTNRGAQPEEFQMLYHVNFGKPLLEEGAKFIAPLARVTPFNANAARDVDKYNQFAGPTPGYIEQVYLFQALADQEGRTTIGLVNKSGTAGTSITYAVKELPYLTLWKNTSAEADGYVTGLEPGTNYPNNRRVERAAGRVPKLAGGASHAMTLDFGIHADKGQVEELTRRIAAIQGGREPIIDRQPAKPH
jgi:hypothetical protein